MADKTIGELPSLAQVTSGTLIPAEQNGNAGKMTGAQFAQWAQDSVSTQVTAAQQAAQTATQKAGDASDSATSAAADAVTATAAKNAIINMGVVSNTLDPGSTATVTKTESQGVVTLTFGIPQGATGAQGPQGVQGIQGEQGPKGDTGTAVAVETSGMYYFNVDNNESSPTFGHLFLTYTGETAPEFEINNDGHLIWTVE